MRRILWAVLFIGLIGTATAGVFFLFEKTGHVKVVTPSISVTGMDLEFGDVAQGTSSAHAFTITNNQIDFGVKLTYSTTLNPLTGALILTDSAGADIQGLCLADGEIVSGNAVLAILQTAPLDDATFTLTINGDFC